MEKVVRRRILWMSALAVAWLALAQLSSCALKPRTDRDWDPYLAHTTDVAVDGEHVSITPVTDWSYTAEGPSEVCYRDVAFDMSELRDVWFMLEPQPGSEVAAHTLLLFELEGDRLIGLTIEARREVGERYTAWRGLWNGYELSYVWGSARDFLVRRAVLLNHDVYIYPLAITDPQKQMLLSNLLARTEALETEPRWYNTLFSNCTNELAKAAGIKWHYSFFLTGKSDEHLFRSGTIPGSSFEVAHAEADVSALIRELNAVDPAQFDAALLEELRARRERAATPEGAAAE